MTDGPPIFNGPPVPQDMPPAHALHVQPVCEPWDVAVDAVCGSLETYAAWRLLSGDISGCAHAAGITDATAARFERTLDAISDETSGGTDG